MIFLLVLKCNLHTSKCTNLTCTAWRIFTDVYTYVITTRSRQRTFPASLPLPVSALSRVNHSSDLYHQRLVLNFMWLESCMYSFVSNPSCSTFCLWDSFMLLPVEVVCLFFFFWIVLCLQEEKKFFFLKLPTRLSFLVHKAGSWWFFLPIHPHLPSPSPMWIRNRSFLYLGYTFTFSVDLGIVTSEIPFKLRFSQVIHLCVTSFPN